MSVFFFMASRICVTCRKALISWKLVLLLHLFRYFDNFIFLHYCSQFSEALVFMYCVT